MTNSEQQIEQMKTSFVQATKEILKGEGLSSVSVRNVASQAGYSYATMYNYFRDVSDLVYACMEEFQQEIRDSVSASTAEKQAGLKHLKATLKAYMLYFVQYPGIFELFFIENFSSKGEANRIVSGFLDSLCDDDWQQLQAEQDLSQEQVEQKKLLVKHSVTGMLLMYLHRKDPEKFLEFMARSEAQLDLILNVG